MGWSAVLPYAFLLFWVSGSLQVCVCEKMMWEMMMMMRPSFFGSRAAHAVFEFVVRPAEKRLDSMQRDVFLQGVHKLKHTPAL